MSRHGIEDRRQRVDPQRVMPRDGDVMLVTRAAGEADMAAGLARGLITKPPPTPDQVRSEEIAGNPYAASTS